MKAKYDPDLPTCNFGVAKFRRDLKDRIRALARRRGVTVNELMNQMIEGALNVWETAQARKEARKGGEDGGLF